MEREVMRRRIRLEEEEEEEEVDLMCKLHEKGIAGLVFSRLPITTILRCLSVKKSWSLMLEQVVFAASTEFAENHLENLLKEEDTAAAATGYILLIQKKDNSLYLEPYLAEYVDEYSYKVNPLFCPTPPPKWPSDVLSMDYKKIVGSCNGLICLSKRISHKTVDFDPIFIYNPILKESLDLPPIKYFNKYKFNDEITMAVGFGYYYTTKENIKKYKVVRIYYQTVGGGGGEVQIYTLGERMWKTIGEKVSYQLQSKEPGVLLNGSLHWLIEKENEPVMIVALDLETEVFNVVQPPVDLPIYDSDTWTQLIELEGRLSLTHVTEGYIQLWILMDAAAATWMKKEITLTIDKEYAYYMPYASRKKLDEVLLSCPTVTKEAFCFYNFKDNKLVEILKTKGNRKEDVITHTNSFLSLKAMGEDGIMMKTNDRN